MKILLEAGADATYFNYWGSVLHIAAERGHEEVCLLLIAAGADVNVRSEYVSQRYKSGVTPLEVAKTPTIADVMKKAFDAMGGGRGRDKGEKDGGSGDDDDDDE